MGNKPMSYVDYLKKYMEGLVTRYIADHKDNLPAEFEGIPKDRLLYLLVDHATPILRKIEDDAINASVNTVCLMIRFAKKQEEEK